MDDIYGYREQDIKGLFICDWCRNECEFGKCHGELSAILSKDPGDELSEDEKKGLDLVGRKQIVKCLGPYCTDPCQHQLDEFTPYNSEDGLKALFDSLKYLTWRLDKELTREKE